MSGSINMLKQAAGRPQQLAMGSIFMVLLLLAMQLFFLYANALADDSSNAQKLLALAKQYFYPDTLTAADKKLFRSVATGEWADYRTGDTAKDNPVNADQWGNDRTLAAERIAWLCTDKQVKELVTHKGIQIGGARIKGKLDLENIDISFWLQFFRCALPQDMNLLDASVRGLLLDGSQTGPINADGIKVAGDLFLRDGFKAEGEVRMLGAEIGGDLDCEKGQFRKPKGDALSADRIKVAGSVCLRNGFKAEGDVRLPGAKIGGNLDCINGQFSNGNDRAIVGDNIRVAGDLFLRSGFRAEGEVRLPGAEIGGILDCTKGQFSNPKGYALTADGIKVEGSVFLRDGFKAKGKIDLVSSEIGGYLICRGVDSAASMTLDLRAANVGTLLDDAASWPDSGKLYLDGFVYERLDDRAPRDAKSRIEWLRRQPDGQFLPQPYEQLAAVFKREGLESEAKKILIAKEEDPARLHEMNVLEMLWHYIEKWTICYGYRPWYALLWALALVIIGWWRFRRGYRKGALVPVGGSGSAFNLSHDASGSPARNPHFSPFMYSLDVFLPIIDLHQERYWFPDPACGDAPRLLFLVRVRRGRSLRWFMWFLIIAGWMLTSLFIAGLTRAVRS